MNRLNEVSGCAKWSFLVFAFVASPSIYGDGIKTCSPKEAKAAEVVAASISSWKKLHYVFHKYGHCDDGAIGEGFSESISVLMTEQWKSIDQFVRLSKKIPLSARLLSGILMKPCQLIAYRKLNLMPS